MTMRLELFGALISGDKRFFKGCLGATLRIGEHVQPLHITVFNVARNQSTEVYPYSGDSQRREFGRLEKVVVNENAGVFGFEAAFDAEGFGPAAEKQVPRSLLLPRNWPEFNEGLMASAFCRLGAGRSP